MSKYLALFSLAWQNEFVYRTNFVLWRVRGLLAFTVVYTLWSNVYINRSQIFGYPKEEMFTYIFLVLVLRSAVLAIKSVDVVGSEIASGDLGNYLLKPLSYFSFWFFRDLGTKILNLIFSVVEIGVLWILLKPQLALSLNVTNIFLFAVACIVAAAINFFVSMIFMSISFWTPENTWGAMFLMLVIFEMLGGLLYPLDILPNAIQNILFLTPFPYLVYVPIKIILGQVNTFEAVSLLFMSVLMLGFTYICARLIWSRGLRVFSADGR